MKYLVCLEVGIPNMIAGFNMGPAAPIGNMIYVATSTGNLVYIDTTGKSTGNWPLICRQAASDY